ncbi:hypothetical protein PT191_01960 [Erysipelothrix rhusiopathiae]|nr:hypothetical protein [Erysipelothrix rhusiopathiae]
MVGKLFKNDLVDSYRAYAPVVGMMIAGCVLIILMIQLAINDRFGIFGTFLALALFALVVIVTVMSVRANIYVLYTSIYHKNGYRLFTLPVKTWQILVSKLLVAFFWSVIMGLLLILSLFIITFTTTGSLAIYGQAMQELSQYFTQYFESSVAFFAVIDNLLNFALSSLVILFAGAVAHSSYFQNNRGLVAVGIAVLIAIILGQIGAFVDTSFGSVLLRYDSYAFLQGGSIPVGELALVVLYQILVCGFLAYGTLWFWNHKLEVM